MFTRSFSLHFSCDTPVNRDAAFASTVTLCLLVAGGAHAQAPAPRVFVNSDTTINTNVNASYYFVGKDNLTSFKTQPGTATLTITTGATIAESTNILAGDGKYYNGVNAFGTDRIVVNGTDTREANDYNVRSISGFENSQLSVSGGSVEFATANNSATLNVTGGFTYYATGNNNSTVTLSGGKVTSARSYGTSTLNVMGGNINSAVGYDSSTVNISSNLGSTTSSGSSTVNVLSGSLSFANSIDNGTLNMLGGSAILTGSGSGTINQYSYVNSTTMRYDSVLNLHANTGVVSLYDRGTVNVYGTNLRLTYQGRLPQYDSYYLTGTTENGDSFSTSIWDYIFGSAQGSGPTLSVQDPYSGTGNVRFFAPSAAAAPEPSALALLIPALPLAGVLLRRRRV